MIEFITILILLTVDTQYQSEPCAYKFSGDYHLKSGDTLREDVSVSSGNAMIDGVIDGDLAVMGGSVTINGTIDGDVAVFGGEIENYGKITGDAAVAGGSVKNKGTIDGDIAVAGGTVILDSGSVVMGDIAIVGGSVDRSDFAVVEGQITTVDIGKIDKIMPRLSRLLRLRQNPCILGSGLHIVTSIAFIIVMYILNLLLLLIFPKAIEKIGNKIKKNIWACIAIGIGIEILFVPLILLFVISIIGIPIIPAFVLALFIGMLFGISGFSVVLGERICTGLNWNIDNKIGLFSIGWLGIMIILIIGTLLKNAGFFGTLIWLLGIVIVYVAVTIGIGGVLYALVKKDKEII